MPASSSTSSVHRIRAPHAVMVNELKQPLQQPVVCDDEGVVAVVLVVQNYLAHLFREHLSMHCEGCLY